MKLSFVALVVGVALCGGSQARSGSGDFANANTYVDGLNAVRARVQKPSVYKGEWKPLPPLAWSDEVATSAQAWADHLRKDNKCRMQHSDSDYGENLAGGKKLEPAVAVKLWADEGKHYSYAPVYDFYIPTAHYTQVVWRKTAFVGCGRATCGKDVVIVCQFSPHGNVIGRAPY